MSREDKPKNYFWRSRDFGVPGVLRVGDSEENLVLPCLKFDNRRACWGSDCPEACYEGLTDENSYVKNDYVDSVQDYDMFGILVRGSVTPIRVFGNTEFEISPVRLDADDNYDLTIQDGKDELVSNLAYLSRHLSDNWSN